MAYLIDKDAVVAEINRLYTQHSSRFECDEAALCLEELEDFIDTLEVKEVDLEKELSLEDYKSFFEKHPDLSDDWGFDEAWIFAKHFFELGMQVSNKAQKGEKV